MTKHLFTVRTHEPTTREPHPDFVAVCGCGWEGPGREKHGEAEVDGWAHEKRVCERCDGWLEDPGEPMPDRSGQEPICSTCRAEVFA